MRAKAQINAAVGANFANIYFQPCCEEYAKTVIVLYRGKRLIGKYEVEGKFFFKSISGLAYGNYNYDVIRYDKNGKELFKESGGFTLQLESYYH